MEPGSMIDMEPKRNKTRTNVIVGGGVLHPLRRTTLATQPGEYRARSGGTFRPLNIAVSSSDGYGWLHGVEAIHPGLGESPNTPRARHNSWMTNDRERSAFTETNSIIPPVIRPVGAYVGPLQAGT